MPNTAGSLASSSSLVGGRAAMRVALWRFQ
jgi:hypothetical protein